jgi:hypothetical protein
VASQISSCLQSSLRCVEVGGRGPHVRLRCIYWPKSLSINIKPCCCQDKLEVKIDPFLDPDAIGICQPDHLALYGAVK